MILNKPTKNIQTILVVILSIAFSNSYGQKIENQIQTVNSIEEANKFVQNNENMDAQVWTVAPKISSEKSDQIFENRHVGDIFYDENNTYKIIEERNKKAFQVSYIFLDETKMSLNDINNLRKKILNNFKKGVSFSDLANQYTMDSSKDGDLNWFTEGTMVKEFETAIKNHKMNDVFTIDLAKEKWYYVVLKTFQDQEVEELTILKIKS